MFSLFILCWILCLLYNLLSSTKHTPFCLLLVVVCSSLMIALFYYDSDIVCVTCVFAYHYKKTKKQLTITRSKITRTMKEKSITVVYEFLLSAFSLNWTTPNKAIVTKIRSRISYLIMWLINVMRCSLIIFSCGKKLSVFKKSSLILNKLFRQYNMIS